MNKSFILLLILGIICSIADTRLQAFLLVMELLLGVNLGLEDTDEGQSAVTLGIVQTVADNELVGNLTADIVGHEGDLAAAGLIQQSTGADGANTLEFEIAAQVGQGLTGVDDILDDENIGFLEILAVQIQDNIDIAGRGSSVNVRGDAHEINLDGGSDVLHQITHKDDRALQDAKQNKALIRIVGVVGADLSRQTLNDLFDLILGEQDFINVRIVDAVVNHIYLQHYVDIDISIPHFLTNCNPIFRFFEETQLDRCKKG